MLCDSVCVCVPAHAILGVFVFVDSFVGIPVCSICVCLCACVCMCMCLCSHLSTCLARGGSLQAQPCLQPHHKETGPQVKHGFSGLCSLSHGPPCLLPSPHLVTKHFGIYPRAEPASAHFSFHTRTCHLPPHRSALVPHTQAYISPFLEHLMVPLLKDHPGPPLWDFMDQTHNVCQEVSLDTSAQGEDSLYFVCMPL